jgi:YidC/Oxa1 family membrane protein insertase
VAGTSVSDVKLPAGNPQADNQGLLPVDNTFLDVKTVLTNDKNRLKFSNSAVTGSIDLITGRFDDLTLSKYNNTFHSDDKIRLLAPRNTQDGFFAEVDYVIKGIEKSQKSSVWQVVSGDLNTANTAVILQKKLDDIIIDRKITIDDNYLFTISDTITNTSKTVIDITPYGLVNENDPAIRQSESSYVVHTGFVGYINDSAVQMTLADIKDDKLFKDMSVDNSTGGWVGITDKYWATILIPDSTEAITMRAVYNPYAGHDGYQADYTLKTRSIAAGQAIIVNNRLFAGAKSVPLINQYQDEAKIQGFDFLIDWGWFWFFTRPIFKGLLLFYSYVGNYGIAILLLTLLLKTLFFPLANKSYVAMSRMKKLQPEMEKIRTRNTNDPMAQQQELVALYKREKINPVAGCWPMLLQIPVFFALYKVLNVALELRHQPFYGWIHDLSAADPTNIFTLFGLIPAVLPSFLHLGVWPLLMGVTMWLQQKLNPAPSDPIQAKMMSLFPIIFTFVLAPFSAGLVIYWTWNNILSIIQQAVIMKRLGVPVEFSLWSKQKNDKAVVVTSTETNKKD